MKKIYPTLLSAIILSMGSLAAQNALHKEIHLSTTGSLPKELSLEEAKGLTSIKVTGEINETDIALLNNMASAGKLEKIDLSEATFGETKDPLLLDVSQYFLPMIAALKTDDIDAMEAYEAGLGHEKDPRSVPGFWTFFTKKRDVLYDRLHEGVGYEDQRSRTQSSRCSSCSKSSDSVVAQNDGV